MPHRTQPSDVRLATAVLSNLGMATGPPFLAPPISTKTKRARKFWVWVSALFSRRRCRVRSTLTWRGREPAPGLWPPRSSSPQEKWSAWRTLFPQPGPTSLQVILSWWDVSRKLNLCFPQATCSYPDTSLVSKYAPNRILKIKFFLSFRHTYCIF